MRTVERRSCSAISPNPGMAMLLSSMRAFANDNVGFLKSPAANEFEWQGFPNGFGAKLPVNVFKTSDGIAGESHKNVANDDASLVCGTLRFDLEDDRRSFVIPLKRSPKRIRQTHRLQTDTKIAARDAAFLQKRFHDTVHRRSRNGDGAKACETRSGDADDLAMRVNDRATNRRRLHADVEANVRSKRCAGPGASLLYNQTNSAKGSHRAAGACASDNQREAAGLD